MDMKLLVRSLRSTTDRESRNPVLDDLYIKLPGHIDDHDLERYHLGMVKDEVELAALEEHLLWCQGCVDRAEAAAPYVDAIRSAVCERGDDF